MLNWGSRNSTNSLVHYTKIADLFTKNNVLAGFDKEQAIVSQFRKIASAIKQINTSLNLKKDQNNTLFIYENKNSNENYASKLWASIKLNLEEKTIEIRYSKEIDKSERQILEVFLNGNLKIFKNLENLIEERLNFIKSKSQIILEFSILLKENFTYLLPIVTRQRANLGAAAKRTEVIKDLDNFATSLLPFIDNNLDITTKISLLHPLCYDLLEVIINYRYLFTKKNDLIKLIMNNLPNNRHPHFDLLKEIFYEEVTLEEEIDIYNDSIDQAYLYELQKYQDGDYPSALDELGFYPYYSEPVHDEFIGYPGDWSLYDSPEFYDYGPEFFY